MTRVIARLIAALPIAVLPAAGVGVCAPLPPPTTVQFTMDLRGEITAGRFDPGTDRVGVRGAVAPLSWEQTQLARASTNAGLYELTLRFKHPAAEAQPIPYKFKIEHPGRPDAGWESGRNRSFVLGDGARLQRLRRAFGEDSDALPAQRVGTIERWTPQPSARVSPREVQVWLPPGYAEQPERRYPVLYLHDGQNLFDALAAGAEWQIDETAQRLLLADAIAPMIIVGVASNDDRITDYTPVPNTAAPDGPVGGGGPGYAHYLVQELKPQIDQHYRTQPGREATAVGGSSLGGLMSMWLVLNEPNTFGAALVVSPAAWWADYAIVEQARGQPWPSGLTPPRVWMDVGAREGDGMIGGARALRDALLARGWQLHYLEQPDGGHDEASWAARVEPMLRWLHGIKHTGHSP